MAYFGRGRVLFKRGLTCSLGWVTPFVSREMPTEVSDGGEGRGESHRAQGGLLRKVPSGSPARARHIHHAYRGYTINLNPALAAHVRARTPGTLKASSEEEEARTRTRSSEPAAETGGRPGGPRGPWGCCGVVLVPNDQHGEKGP